MVAPAVGHIYGLKEKGGGRFRHSYPTFEVEWVPSYKISKDSAYTRAYLSNLKFLSKNVTGLINACDYDIEGSVIGFNTIKYACGVDPFSDNVKRMKFSTLTTSAIMEAYNNLIPLNKGMINAGLVRHTMDWYWGINLSRALNSATRKAHRYVTLSIGRVQGPTLKMLAEREKEIQKFIPKPYWNIKMLLETDGERFVSFHEKDRFWDKEQADKVEESCGNIAVIDEIKKQKTTSSPPYPFDLTTLQTEAYKQLGIDPRKTLEVAQDLYTSGAISYPRTSSQILPPAINFIEIIKKLEIMTDYSGACKKLLKKKKLTPNNGKRKDPAHPAIYPTPETPKWKEIKARAEHKKIYDLIVRRFLATFGDPLIREITTLRLNNSGEIFIARV